MSSYTDLTPKEGDFSHEEVNLPQETKIYDYEILVTQSQHEAITHPVDPNKTLQIIAGPGSGKTMTLVYKIAHLIGDLQIHPADILVLSMTNKAVEALQIQLKALVGDFAKVDVTTFHGFAHRCVLFQQEHEGEGNDSGIQILEESGWRTLLSLMGGKARKHDLLKAIAHIRENGWNEAEIKKLCRSLRIDPKALKDVMETLDTSKLMIHSDILRNAKQLLRDNTIRMNYKVVIVDEFQDLYPELFELVKLVSKGLHLVIAGDPDQSIYSFLGSNIDVNKSLVEFKPLDKILLQETFRSTPEIIQASDYRLGKENPSIALKEIQGFKPTAKFFYDITEQYEWIAMEMIRLMKESDGVIHPNDFAVLARTNSELSHFAKVLNYFGILDFRLTSSPTWLSNGLFHLIDYLKVIYRPEASNFPVMCTLSLLPGVGPVTVKKLLREAIDAETSLWSYLVHINGKGNLPPKLLPYVKEIKKAQESIDLNDPHSIFQTLLTLGNDLGLAKLVSLDIVTKADKEQMTTQILEFFENLKLSQNYKEEDTSLTEHFLKNYMDILPIERNKNSARLATIHAAKGLEFPIVFVLGHPYKERSPEDKKLNYVAMTRAKTLLYMNMMNTEPSSLQTFKSRYNERFFTSEKPEISGQFIKQFAKEYKRPLKSPATRISTRSFHTFRQLIRRIH